MPVAIVTGSSSGIGRATAIELAQKGFDLVLHGCSNQSGLQTTASQIKRQEPARRISCATADLADIDSCAEFARHCFRLHPRIDAWINIAGADILTGEIASSDFEKKLERLLEVDVRGTIRLCRLVGHQFRLQSESREQNSLQSDLPSLINIGWDQATTGMEGDAGQLFCPTKAAIQAFTRSLALDLAGVARVNLVAPGWIQTKWGEHAEDYWDQRAKQESLSGRWGQAQEVAQAIAWLCSSDAQFVNSQILELNGGLRAHQHLRPKK